MTSRARHDLLSPGARSQQRAGRLIGQGAGRGEGKAAGEAGGGAGGVGGGQRWGRRPEIGEIAVAASLLSVVSGARDVEWKDSAGARVANRALSGRRKSN